MTTWDGGWRLMTGLGYQHQSDTRDIQTETPRRYIFQLAER